MRWVRISAFNSPSMTLQQTDSDSPGIPNRTHLVGLNFVEMKLKTGIHPLVEDFIQLADPLLSGNLDKVTKQ